MPAAKPFSVEKLHPTGSDGWLALTQEPILDPELPIVDPHHHLWGPPRSNYLTEQFDADAFSGHNIVGTVFVECSEGYWTDGPEALRPVGETEMVAALAETRRASTAQPMAFCAGIVGHADLLAGSEVRAVLEAHIEAGRSRFRGIRQSSAWDPHDEIRTTIRTPPAHMLAAPAFRQGFAELRPLGLTFDSWVYFHQLEEVAQLAKAFPDTPIIVNHAGGPIGIGPYAARQKEVFEEWNRGIQQVAQYPNTYIKLGGLAMRLGGYDYHLRPRPASSQEMSDDWRPYIETCIAKFGPDRAMFETNFPVDKLSCSYALLWNAFKRLTSAYSPSEKSALFSQTAAKIYRLELKI